MDLLLTLGLVTAAAWVAYALGRSRLGRGPRGRPGSSEARPEAAGATAQERETRERLRELLETLSVGVTLHDPDGAIVFANPASSALLRVGSEALLGSRLLLFDGDALGDDGGPLGRGQEPVALVLATGQPVRQLVMGLRPKGGGERFWLSVNAEPRLRSDGRLEGVVCTFSDVTEARRANERVRYLAYHDGLTQLPNRELFLDRLGVALAHAQRRGTGVGLLFVDLDGFKVLNDTAGHASGDSVLRTVAQRLSSAVRESDVVARYGGNEFTVLLPGVERAEEVVAIANQVRDAIRRPVAVGERAVALKVSLGASLYPRDGQDVDTLLKNADTALQHAKELGRDRLEFFTPELGHRVSARLDLDARLRGAVQAGELELHYQPIVSLSNGCVEAYESLVRWNDPQRGLVYPDAFIPAAEAGMGAIFDLGVWSLTTACRQLRQLPVQCGTLPRVTVNVSARQFHDGDIVERVASVLAENAMTPGSLEIEITERVALRGEGATEEILKRLKDLGVRLAIDDFGTGYSALAYLRRFPIDTLKVDRSFVGDAVNNREAAAITRAIIGVGQQLGLRVVAEGVETEEQLRLLRLTTCDAVQGYLLAVPVPVSQLVDHVAGIPGRWPKGLERP
jgi:diguanylate cyclase (GGDEF)-like protein